jgi:mono/diheme cytochrome c family protein
MSDSSGWTIMPPYKDGITDDGIKQIILYIRSLK